MGQPAFLDLAEPVGGDDLVTGSGKGLEVPQFLPVERVGIFAALEEDVLHGREVVLQTVIYTGKQAGAEGRLQHPAFEFDLVAVPESAGALEDLDGGEAAVDLDDFRHHLHPGEVDEADFILGDRPVHRDGDQVRDDARYDSCCFHL